MLITPKYPGVYIQERSNGVRSITGVSTSVTAFLGQARQGPINKAVRIQSFAEFERRFGPLHKDYDLGYAVAAFFRNGGGDAIVVRVARNPAAAKAELTSAADVVVLNATALEQGGHGNDIRLQIDRAKKNPASAFDLTVTYAPTEGAPVVETFPALSMNAHDPCYAPDVVNRASALVTLTRPASLTMPTDKGTSRSGDLTGVTLASQLDANHDRFLVACNGEVPVSVVLVAGDLAALGDLATAIQTKVRNTRPDVPGYAGFECAADGSTLLLKSGEGGENSTVRILPAPKGDLSVRLKLGAAGGGTETDGSAAILPRPAPQTATLTFKPTDSKLATLPSAAKNQLVIGLDGKEPDTIELGSTPATDLAGLANLIQAAVRRAKPADPSSKAFTATVDGTNLVLTSGSRGSGSVVFLAAANANDVANDLGLLGGTAASEPDLNLKGGGGESFDAGQAYDVLFGHAAEREGIYALEEVDLFNLLVLPGMTSASVQNEAVAYAAARRAFTILDPPRDKDQPDEIGAYVEGPDLTKSAGAALYYPWIMAADPLDENRIKPFPPSGAIAGLYARTDANRGIWKAPAGIEANLINVQGTDYVLTDGQNGLLNPQGLNAIRVFPRVGTVVWGARTLRGDDNLADEYKYVPVRRLAYYLEESLLRGLQWAVFEPNDEPLWGQIRLAAGSFMQTLFRQGAFAGSSLRDAYFVRCDRETNTPADVASGIVNVLVGFAPLRPAEFVIVTIQQMAGQGG